MFLCEGVKVLFRVGLVLIKYSLPHKVRRKCPSKLIRLVSPPQIYDKLLTRHVRDSGQTKTFTTEHCQRGVLNT